MATDSEDDVRVLEHTAERRAATRTEKGKGLATGTSSSSGANSSAGEVVHDRDDIAMYDEDNPIMEWLCTSRSESLPTLDEYEDCEPESPRNPSRFLLEELGGLNEEDMAAFKRKIGSGRKGCKKRKAAAEEEEDIVDNFEFDDNEGGGSPTYAESGSSDSNTDEGDSEDGGAGCPSLAASPSHEGVGQATDAQPAPLRPRSKRLKKISVKGLYMLQKLKNGVISSSSTQIWSMD